MTLEVLCLCEELGGHLPRSHKGDCTFEKQDGGAEGGERLGKQGYVTWSPAKGTLASFFENKTLSISVPPAITNPFIPIKRRQVPTGPWWNCLHSTCETEETSWGEVYCIFSSPLLELYHD